MNLARRWRSTLCFFFVLYVLGTFVFFTTYQTPQSHRNNFKPPFEISLEPPTFHLLWTTTRNSSIQLFESKFPRDQPRVNGAWKDVNQRSVESILYHHPLSTIIIHDVGGMLSSKQFENLQSYGYDIRIEPSSARAILANTPLFNWFTSSFEPFKGNPHYYSHVTDLMRLAVLWKYGGIYSDTDMIFVKPIHHLYNTIGLQHPLGSRSDAINGAIMIFDRMHPFLTECMLQLQHHYDKDDWSSAGPKLLTRTYTRLCGTSTKDSCVQADTNLVDVNAFYVLEKKAKFKFKQKKVSRHGSWKCFFGTNDALSLINKIKKESYAVHLNGKITSASTPLEGSACNWLLNTFTVREIPKKKEAWVTLLTSDYSDSLSEGGYPLGVLVLLHQLEKFGNTRDVIVMVTSKVKHSKYLEAIAQKGGIVRRVDAISKTLPGMNKRHKNAFTVLHCWNLTDYDKVVFIDADILMLRPMNNLFGLKAFAAARLVNRKGKTFNTFNSGLMVLEPSRESFLNLLKLTETEYHVYSKKYPKGWAVQAFLNHVFEKKCNEIPYIYNGQQASGKLGFLPKDTLLRLLGSFKSAHGKYWIKKKKYMPQFIQAFQEIADEVKEELPELRFGKEDK